jgi:hypothetical protein
MKLKSELYVYELNAILFGLHLQLEESVKALKREKRKAHVAAFLTPWLSREVWTALSVKAEVIMRHVNQLSELREKIMQAEGMDDNLGCITFQQMCENANQD